MRVGLLCATLRGLRFLRRLRELLPEARLLVFSFREEPWEPRFLDAIREEAGRCGAEFHEARHVGAAALQPLWDAADLDLMFAVSWRYMVPPAVYTRPRRGTFVFHDSLLPEYRGFSPTVWAVINGEDHTGVTLFEIDETVDSGPIVDQERVPIGPDDAIGEVLDRVTEAYLRLLERSLPGLLAGTAARRPQDASRATYLCKRLPEDSRIRWEAPAGAVYNLIRGYTDPYPGAFTNLGGRVLRVWAARRLPDFPPYAGRIPGRVVQVRRGEGAVVLAGEGALLLKEVQPEEGERVCGAEVLNSLSLTLG